MVHNLQVNFFGEFSLHVRSEAQAEWTAIQLPPTAKSQSLLAYLIIYRDDIHLREQLAEQFWPDRPPRRARRSLSTSLWHIHRGFAEINPLESDNKTVQFRFPGTVTLDVEQFEAAFADRKTLENLQKSVAIFQGNFLDGYYDDWIINRRYRYQSQYVDASTKLMHYYQEQNDNHSVLEIALKLLELDPLQEDAHRAVMAAYAKLGQRSAALKQYKRCQKIFSSELGVEPARETTALHEQILSGELGDSSGRRTNIAETIFSEGSEQAAQSGGIKKSLFSALAGRIEEKKFLQERWLRTEKGQGGVVFLTGEAGIGKTSLAKEFEGHLRRRGAAVLSTACYEFERGQPYAPLVDILHAALDLGGEGVIREMSNWQLLNLARLDPEVTRFLPAERQHSLSVEAEQKHLFLALNRLLIELSRRTKLIILLEDLHWAHETTLAWLQSVAAQLRHTPLLILTTYRTEEVPPDSLLYKLSLNLQSTHAAETLELPRLSRQEMKAWLPDVPQDFLAKIYQHTQGNPFFIQETLRALYENGDLIQVKGSWRLAHSVSDLPVPETVRQAIQLRLKGLSSKPRHALETASVIGRSFDLDVWIDVCGDPRNEVMESLDVLLRHHFLIEGVHPFSLDYEFCHHIVREIVYQEISLSRVKKLHLKTAHVLEEQQTEEEGNSAKIAFHYIHADEWQTAQSYLTQAGDSAMSASATSEALGFYKRSLGILKRSLNNRNNRTAQAVLEHKIGDVYFHQGVYDEALHHFTEALEQLGRPFPSTKGRLRYHLLFAVLDQMFIWFFHRWIGKRRNTDTDVLEELEIYFSMGWVLIMQAHYEAFFLLTLRSLNKSERAGLPRQTALAATAFGIGLDFVPFYGLASYYFNHAGRFVDELHAPLDIGFMYFGASHHAYLTGDEEACLEWAAISANAFKDAGDAHRWAVAVLRQAYVYLHRCETKTVRILAAEIQSTGEEMQDPSIACIAEALFGFDARLRGDLHLAVEHFQRATKLASAVPDYASLTAYLSELGRCYMRLGDWEKAIQVITNAGQIIDEHDVKGVPLGYYYNCRAEIYLFVLEKAAGGVHQNNLVNAQKAVRDAILASKQLCAGLPEALRLEARLHWIMGKEKYAKKNWLQSITQAEVLGHTLDGAVSMLELGLRTKNNSLQAEGIEKFEALDAFGEKQFLFSICNPLNAE